MTSKPLNQIDDVAYELQDLAASFAHTGNSKVAQSLEYYAKTLVGARNEIHRKQIAESNERFQQVQQGSANVLNAILGGIELGKKEMQDEPDK